MSRQIMWIDANCLRPGARQAHVEDPTWSDVERAIRALDGVHTTEISLMRKEGDGMSITGGLGARYLCQVISDQGTRVLKNLQGDGAKGARIVMDGEADFPEDMVADLASVLTSARTYFESGIVDEHFGWE